MFVKSEIESTKKQIEGSDKNVNISGETEDYYQGYLDALEYVEDKVN